MRRLSRFVVGKEDEAAGFSVLVEEKVRLGPVDFGWRTWGRSVCGGAYEIKYQHMVKRSSQHTLYSPW